MLLATLGAPTDGSISNSQSQPATELCGFAPVCIFLANLPARAAAPRRQSKGSGSTSPYAFFLPHLMAIRALCWLNYISKARRRFASGSLPGPGRPRLAWGGAAASSRHQDNQDEPRPYLWLFIDTGKRFVCSFLLLEEVTGKKKK